MKILLVSEFFPSGGDLQFSGGVEARTYFLAKNLAKKHQVCILTSLIDDYPKLEKMHNFKIIRVGPKRAYIARAGNLIERLKFVYNCIKKGGEINSDIVEGTNFITHFIAKEISNRWKIPVVAWYPDVWVGSWIKNAGIVGLFGEILERINLKRGFNGYIGISKVVVGKLKKKALGKIVLIYCGIDPQEFRESLVKKDEPLILSIARFVKYKNQEVLIRAMKLLNGKVECKLVLVGSGPEKGKLIELTKFLGLENKVIFRGDLKRGELIQIIKSSTIFSLPSVIEGFGIVTIEAAAAGLPFVNSDILVQREVTKNGLGGFLVKADNPKMFADKISLLLLNKDLYRKKSREAKGLAKVYDWSKIAEKTEKFYEEVIEDFNAG